MKRTFLLITLIAITLSACADPLLPGETTGCNGVVCGIWKDGGSE